MRAASILPALVLVLGFVGEAGAWIRRDRSIEVGKYRFGFTDWSPGWHGGPIAGSPYSMMHAGPLGEWQVPFTATQGLIGFCCIPAMLIIVPAVLTVQWKKRQV